MASTPTEAQGWTEVLARCLGACVLPACTSPGAAPNLRAADLPFQCSTYLPAKACCLESTRLRPNRWIRKSHSPECQVHDVVGDGRCGYRALAHYLGVSCTSVMQRIAQIMAAAGACPAPELIQLLAACDLRAPCDRSAWLTSAHLQLVVNFMSCNFPEGILVRLDHHSAGSPDSRAGSGPDLKDNKTYTHVSWCVELRIPIHASAWMYIHIYTYVLYVYMDLSFLMFQVRFGMQG